jgi:hypothetical protein
MLATNIISVESGIRDLNTLATTVPVRSQLQPG